MLALPIPILCRRIIPLENLIVSFNNVIMHLTTFNFIDKLLFYLIEFLQMPLNIILI